MFSKELEALIEATLEDGVLEEHEKAALVKRAQREGVDLDELEIYITSILQRRKMEQTKKNEALEIEYEQKRKDALGHVCPNCGRPVPPMTLRCDCGFEFGKIAENSTILEKLSDKLSEIDDWEKEEGESANAFSNRKILAKQRAISMTQVPNTKEDIIEFLSMCMSNSKKKGGVWGTKVGRIAIVLGIPLLIVIILAILFSVEVGELIVLVVFYGFIGWLIVRRVKRKDAEKGVQQRNSNNGLSKGLGKVGESLFESPLFEYNELTKTWYNKFDQVMLKARTLRGDPEFQQQLDYYERMMKK